MRRPFLVLPNHECVPLEGEYRIEEHQGRWWILGNHEALAYDTEQRARLAAERRLHERDAHALTADALSDLPHDYEVTSALD